MSKKAKIREEVKKLNPIDDLMFRKMALRLISKRKKQMMIATNAEFITMVLFSQRILPIRASNFRKFPKVFNDKHRCISRRKLKCHMRNYGENC